MYVVIVVNHFHLKAINGASRAARGNTETHAAHGAGKESRGMRKRKKFR
jgi:hypothetical protein